MAAAEERHQRLLGLLEEWGELDVADLVRQLHTSEATLRRDLGVLETQGLLMRTFGGAKSIGSSSLVARTFEAKRQLMHREKEAIARMAAGLVQPGMVVALDSGTTAWRVAVALREKGPLTIVTTALAAVEELGPIEGMKVELVGGIFRPTNLDFVGPAAIAGLAAMRADIAFVACDGLMPGRGCFSIDEQSAALAAALARTAERRVVVADHSKFAAQGCRQVLAPGEISDVITDGGLQARVRKKFAAEPYRLMLGDAP